MTNLTTTNQQKSIGRTQSESGESIKDRIFNATKHPKIGQLTDPDDKIKLALKYIFGLIGLKAENLPNDEQKLILIDFIRTEHWNWTPEEFTNAFRMLVAGQLDFDSNHFQNFNAIYFSNVLAAYKKRKIEILKTIAEPMPVKKIDLNEIRKNKIEFINDAFLKPFQFYKKTGKLTFGITPIKIIYDYLCDDFNMIDLSVEEKSEIYKIAFDNVLENWNKTKLNFSKRNRELQSMVSANGFQQTFKNEIKNECYRISIHNHFENCVDFENKIKTYIDNL